MIRVQDIGKSYGNLKVLKGVALEIADREIVTIVGPSGAGKSTLLHIIGSLDRPDTGEVFIDNTSIFSLNDEKLSEFRNQNIGFVFQFHHLLPEFTALENVAMPALIGGSPKKQALKEAEKLLDFMQLKHRLTHKPSELSGGEQQRVAVARALINNPKLILADEPSGNLDTENAMNLHKLFFDLREAFGQTFIIVTHNEELANMSDVRIVIKDGRIENRIENRKL
ncbi:ABC transporter ATP-binding protein [Bacteroidales bacterium OttesenSCG-928-B11]|nr:ABC transporter ATP-binding protein [Bacteroidales bacterium OttesenSCG-928-B11]MDL2326586.1 ABC transporter ATP-binding protein [Bacteroidales bacterium OttesenSCG-928-A14]